MEKITEADPELVSREPVSTLSDTTSRALLFSPVAVDMLGFDKRMSDTKESFLLRNNTPYRLSRVVLKMIYRTPDGQMIDYRTRMVDCDLLPRSTRKCEIESFDRSKNYYHVDSPPSRVSGRPFKVSFQLLRYCLLYTSIPDCPHNGTANQNAAMNKIVLLIILILYISTPQKPKS